MRMLVATLAVMLASCSPQEASQASTQQVTPRVEPAVPPKEEPKEPVVTELVQAEPVSIPVVAEPTVPEKPKPWIPARAVELMPVVNQAMTDYWPDLPRRTYIPAQIEQETCISLKHSKCWSSEAQLKTKREYGFGLGQFTVAYTSTGAVRFNAWEEIKRAHPDLKDWEWEDRLNPILQIRAMTIKNSITWRRSLFPTADSFQRLAFVASEYNGGSTKKDRMICESTPKCDSTRWFPEDGKLAVADVSSKSKVAASGYGKSFFEINREYVRNVLIVRSTKYVPYVE